MRKNINKIEHFDLSIFPNRIIGKYNPKIGSSNPPVNSDNGPSTTSPSPIPSNPPISLPDNSMKSEEFILRSSKLPADKLGNIIPVNTVDPNTNTVTPSVFYESMDETATYNNNTFLKGLNDALSECIKQSDICYAVVIKYQPNNAYDSAIYKESDIINKGIHTPGYKFELAQKPSSPNINNQNDSESLLCNSLYFTYIRETDSMPNSKPCRFDTGEIDYEGSSGNNIIKTGSGSGSSTGSTTKSSSKKPKLSYKEMGKPKPKPAPFPWVMVIGITMGVLFIIGGIYYYYNFGPGAPIVPVKKIVKKVVKGGLLTSKFIKKSGGYFFFV
jgi:hypothetical protein